MSEEEALDIFRELSPHDCALLRVRQKGAKDPLTFGVRISVRNLSGKQLLNLLTLAVTRGCETQVVISSEAPFMLLTKNPG